jgi:hypothetical protein
MILELNYKELVICKLLVYTRLRKDRYVVH